jgi:hypothetical protein
MQKDHDVKLARLEDLTIQIAEGTVRLLHAVEGMSSASVIWRKAIARGNKVAAPGDSEIGAHIHHCREPLARIQKRLRTNSAKE